MELNSRMKFIILEKGAFGFAYGFGNASQIKILPGGDIRFHPEHPVGQLPKDVSRRERGYRQRSQTETLERGASGKKINNLRSYLWRVVYTTALDLIEERMAHLSLEVLVARSERVDFDFGKILSQDSAVEEREHRLILSRVLDSLPERRRAVLRLHLEGMDIHQIAARLHWRENQVRHLLYRGLAEVKEMLKPATSG